jgi:arylsulfatase A-like enzyme
MSKRPNFLFLITDQHRPDHTGFGGNEIVQTPNLDAIAARGVVFDRTFAANPICMPNRSTIMTGRMPSVHGTRYNGVPLNWRVNTFVRVLRAQGYRTTHIGKSHLQNMSAHHASLDDLVDWSVPAEAVMTDLPDGWDELENVDRYRSLEPVPLPDDFYGFERVNFTNLHGDRCGGHYYQWLLQQGVEPASVQGFDHALTYYKGWGQV